MGDDEPGGFLDREELLGGLPARRAATLLFLIETRAARLSSIARQRLELARTDASEDDRGLAFVKAFAQARESTVAPSVYELERQADGWAPLVPTNARLQSALARKFGEKYRFAAGSAPGITKALGLDQGDVRDAYGALYGEPLETVYTEDLSPRERLRWMWTTLTRRLENLPPFWMAFSLTLTEAVGGSILALPMAVADLGPLPGIAILVVLGLVNVLTVSLMAEAVARSGAMRYSNAFLGRLVEGYLGSRGALGLSVLLAATSLIALPLYYVGVGTTLEDATSLPAAAWVAALFVLTMVFVRRGSIDATIGAALVVGAVNLVLVLAMAGIAFAYSDGSNLLHAEIPLTGGRPFDASAIGIVFGVALAAYFGHVSAVLCGSLVLDRDPSGRAMRRGCAGAIATAIVVFCIFVLATNGAIGADALAGVTGTVIGPLAEVAGIGVAILGTVYVALALGMGAVFESLSLSKLVRERIPVPPPHVVLLPRRSVHLLFRDRRNRLRAGLTYLGPAAGGARFALDVERDGHVEHEELVVSGRRDLLPPGAKGGHSVALEVIDAGEQQARVAVTTTLRTAHESKLDGASLDLAAALSLSDEEAALAARGLDEEQRRPDAPLFSARLASRRARSVSSRDALAEDPSTDAPDGRTRTTQTGPAGRQRFVVGRRGRSALSLVPLAACFALGEWFVISGAGSYVGLVSFLGVIVVSLLGGFLPVLLFASSSRKGEYASGTRRGVLRNPVLLTSIYLLFLGMLFVHGLVIWDEPLLRVGALTAGVAMLVFPAVLARAGAFGRRVTVEVRDDQRSGTARFALLSAERPVSGTVSLHYGDDEQHPQSVTGEIPNFDALTSALFEVRPDQAAPPDEVKVWAHRVTSEGESVALPATALVRAGERSDTADLSRSRGELIVPFADAELEVHIVLRESEVRPA